VGGDAGDPAALTQLAAAAEAGGLDVLAVGGGAAGGGATGDGAAGGGATGRVSTAGAGAGGSVGAAATDADDDVLDPWTVLGWVAGVTQRITLVAAGLAVDGPPAVLARAVASLDLLTGGRAELALTSADGGAGGAADALDEAVAVVRGMWTPDRAPLVAPGPAHPVPGAARGPAPAHDVPVWLAGADDPTVDLAARSADTWWLDLGATGGALADVGRRQVQLDRAAARHGREPGDVRRVVTLAGASGVPTVEEVVGLVVDDGVDTVLLATQDPEVLDRWATEVAPAVRSAVAATRAARGTAPAPTRSARVRSARRDGIAYDAVPAGLETVEPGDTRYPAMRSNYLRAGRPGLVLLPRDTAQVAAALTWARTQPVALAVRSGGHGISGRSTNDGGIVLDLRHLDGIEVLDAATRHVRIGAGARWGAVAEALQPHGWALTSGDYGGVGVGGLATAGGLGFLAREHGLTVDHVRAAEVVLADGSVVRADAEHHPELFWGLRGAGGNLGIVTSFDFEVDEVGDVGFAQLSFAVDDVAGYLHDFGALVEAAPRDVTPFLIVGAPRGGQVVAHVLAVVDSDVPETIVERLQPFAMLAPLVQQAVHVLPYTGVVRRTADVHAGYGEPVSRSSLVEHVTPALAEDLERLVRSGAVHFFQIRSAGGAVNDVPADATAYAHRSAGFSLVAMGSERDRVDRLWDALAHHWSGLYGSFDSDPRPERVEDAFPPATLARLLALKERYDPDDVFRHNLPVTSTLRGAARAAGAARAGEAGRPLLTP
ncbi:LLM class flavin-dependent oxidoreductase, partial [Cellulomonas sp. 179-A 4D5 NHS]|uniref:LLM class flavin-dependent oxidoreductase n=1 Tax=Cellulomonas sp. 179-A 4D5 NHS TaxID=3142378 RepID=UPI00399F6E09